MLSPPDQDHRAPAGESVSVDQLLSELRALDIRLVVDGDRLRCSAPKGHLTTELGKRIATHKPELIQALRASTIQSSTISRPPVPGASVPLSFAQERFWFLQSFDPESTDYNITAIQRIFAPVDANLLERALDALTKRHEILRTNFPDLDGTPTQVVQEEASPKLDIHDLRHLAIPERSATAESIMQGLAKCKFDLANEPALRVALIRSAEDDHSIVLTIHHIICDAWSINLFFTELKSFYEGYSRGHAIQAPQLPIQYCDYALWERDRQTSSKIQAQINYWKDKLKGAPRYLDLTLDYARSSSAAYQARAHRFQLSAVTSESLKMLGLHEGATPFMTLLTVFKALLCRYTKQSDIVVGTPVSTRTRSELEQLIGCFINTHVLRTTFSEGITTRELLTRVRSTVLESLDHADVPFETLVSELVTERDLSRSPLFQVAFILQNTPVSSNYQVVGGGTTFDMTLYMWEFEGRFGGCIEYNAALFNPETIAGFSGSYETLATEMADQPDAVIEQLPLMTVAQETEWFEKYHGPSTTIPDVCTHEWVEQQASQTPDAIAVICGQEQLTFREVSMRSNRLAHRLRALGVGPDSLVAVCLDRSTDLVVAHLAVWKAGGAYIPLDPEFPIARLAFMLEDSAAAVLITESRLFDRLPPNRPNLVCLDRDRQLLERESNQRLATSVAASNLAYVLYTSGSTGKPKGVEISHHSLVNFLSSMQQELAIGPSDRLLAITTSSFDISGLELYLPLVSGAQVVIAPRAAVVDGTTLAKLLNDARITIMQATPVTWRLLLESGWRGTRNLKVLCGGEALTRDLADQLIATGAEVWNLYGPTETTIWSTLQRIITHGERVSIGRAIANTQVYVLDERGRAVPPGVTGELYIGGDGLARGYLRREKLTSERFVNSPFHSGKRLYRTGDLARRLPDGVLEYLGRIDHQVKVRGFRIELGEIEAALEQQAGISQAIVVVREDTAGDQRLTAYVISTDRVIPPAAVLRRRLSTILPGYMVPAAFVQCEEFPLTPNRKVDRKALLGPEYRPPSTDEPSASKDYFDRAFEEEYQTRNRYVAPSNHVELVMTEIWREVLGVDKVGVHDNFFELGGHSLSAVRLILRLRSALGMDLPLRCIFINPTIASLSSHILYDATTHGYRYTSEIPKWNCLVPAQPKGTRTPLFFVCGYQNPDDTLLVLSRLIPNLGLDQPVFGFRPRWIEGGGGDYAGVEEMAREFLAELRAVQPRGPYLLGGHCVGGVAALEVAQLLIEEGEEVKLMVLLDTERPSRLRLLLTDLFFMRQRVNHMVEVLSQIMRPGNQTRRQMMRDLVHRKLKIAPSQQTRDADRFYQSKVRYRRLLYSHTPKKYPGNITLIVNDEQARGERDLGWAGIAQGGLDVYAMPGDHNTILTRYGKEVAQAILKCIDGALGEQEKQTALVEVNVV